MERPFRSAAGNGGNTYAGEPSFSVLEYIDGFQSRFVIDWTGESECIVDIILRKCTAGTNDGCNNEKC